VLCLFSMDPLDGEGVIEFHPAIVTSMVDRLFGGEGEMPSRIRELTPIESAVVGRILRQQINELGEAWGEIQQLNLQLKAIERNPQMMQVLSPNEVVLIVTFEIKMEHVVGLMTICYPLMALEPVLKHMELQRSSSRVKPWKKERGEDPLQREMHGVDVEVVAELGRSEVSVKEVLDLQEGDVLRLDRHVEEEVAITVGGTEKLWGRPGERRKQRAIMITRGLQGDEHERTESDAS